MSHLSISLIIGSIFIVTLCQAMARHASFIHSISAAQILLSCGLLYCAMKICTAWLSAPPPPQPSEDENNDQQNK